jgi:predicted Rossmann fold nucleotide-binding protein DprA/Smf involved in DNA uptake
MKKVQAQLKTISKSLAGLVAKIEKIGAQLDTAPAPKKAKAAPKKKAAAKSAAKKAPAKKASDGKDTVLDSVLDVIRKSRNGATIAHLKSKTGLESRQLSNALYKLSKKGKIKSKARGVYIKA